MIRVTAGNHCAGGKTWRNLSVRIGNLESLGNCERISGRLWTGLAGQLHPVRVSFQASQEFTSSLVSEYTTETKR